MSNNERIYLEALACLEQGISIIPITPASERGSKRPAVPWKNYQQKLATRADAARWFHDHAHGLAAVCGEISGGLIMIELEGRAADKLPQLRETSQERGAETAELFHKLTTGWAEVSPSGGFHFYARTPENTHGNRKLARTREGIVLAETRENGGYTVIAPTGGEYHETGRAWTRLAGGPTTLPAFTLTQLDTLLDIFRTLDEAPAAPTLTSSRSHTGAAPARPTPAPAPATHEAGALTPGDEYEAKTSWEDILTPHGWTISSRDATTTYWTRPGKNAGVSATTGRAQDRDRLYVFSSSTVFAPETPYTKFGAYALLNHGGDLSAAARTLAREGYGAPLPPHKDIEIDITGLPGNPAPQPAPATVGARGQEEDAPETDGDPAPLHVDPETGEITATPTPAACAVLTETTEDANAQLLATTYRDTLRYLLEADHWAAWTGTRWDLTAGGQKTAEHHARELFRRLPADDDKQTAWRKRSLSRAGITNSLQLASSTPGMACTSGHFDTNPDQLNTPTSVVDLKTGSLHPHTPEQMHSKTTLTGPEAMKTPMWDRFLNETFKNAPDVKNYVHKLIGYSATGRVGEQILPFFYGTGANGKSVLAEIIQRVLGDYAQAAPAGFLIEKREQHPTELMRLRGARAVFASEVPDGAVFDEAKTKALTGGDTITARKMHQDFVSFQPTHTLFVLGNHQPAVGTGGPSFWRRLRLIPFMNVVPEEARDDQLVEKIIAREAGGVMAWIIEGAVAYYRDGLHAPQSVLAATSDYEESEDHFGRFLEDVCHVGGGSHCTVAYARMRYAYTDWCRLEGAVAASQNRFTREVASRGVGTTRVGGERLYTNVALADTGVGARSWEFGEVVGG